MGMVVGFPTPHGRASSAGYRSGRSSWRETPEARSTARTRKGGTSSHCEIACLDTPTDSASMVRPPAASIARFRDSARSDIARMSSTAEHKSQAWLNCKRQAWLYDPDMHIGERIKLARKRLKPKVTQQRIADLFDITASAVAEWEAGKSKPDPDKYPQLRDILKVTYAWLIEGEGPPPEPTDPRVLLEVETLANYRAAGEKNAPTPTKRPRRA